MVAPFFVQGEDLKSPFEPDGFSSSKEQPAEKVEQEIQQVVSRNPIANEIEMRGYYKLGSVYYFSIHQKKKDLNSKRIKSEWVKKGQIAFEQFEVKSFNPKTKKLSILRSGQARTEEIALHQSKWEAPATGKNKNSGIPSPLKGASSLSTSGGGKPVRRMSPKPNYEPSIPPEVARASIARAFANRSSGGQIAEGSRSSGSSSSSGSSGFMPPSYLPRGFTNSPVPQTPPVAGAAPPIASPEGGGRAITGPSPGLVIPTDPATGEIDLNNLPPPPPPPTIKPPGPPPNIEPSLEDRDAQ